MRFQIIANFEKLDQDIFDIDLPQVYCEDEARFLTMILNCMEEDSIKDLAKLSVFQRAKSRSEVIEWLVERNGKYYFNYGVNLDPDTKSLSEFKIFYLTHRKRIREEEEKEEENKKLQEQENSVQENSVQEDN